MAEWNWFTPVTSKREGYASVAESPVQVVTTSKREGHAGVSELLGYGSTFHDRTGYASVSESPVGVFATSTREGHAIVSELIGYGEVFHDRTGYASVTETQTFREPEYDDIPQPYMGWGSPLIPQEIIRVYKGSAEATSSVSEHLGAMDPDPAVTPQIRDAFASVSEEVVTIQ